MDLVSVKLHLEELMEFVKNVHRMSNFRMVFVSVNHIMLGKKALVKYVLRNHRQMEVIVFVSLDFF